MHLEMLSGSCSCGALLAPMSVFMDIFMSSLLYLNVGFACHNINYLNTANSSFNFHGDGGENNFVSVSRCFL